MRFPAKRSNRPTIHLTALIDIVFLLLIFFLLASSFVEEQGVNISLPQVASESKDHLPDVSVSIDQYGNFFYNEVNVGEETLRVALQQALKQSDSKKLAIYADRRVIYDHVIKVIDIGKQAGAIDFLLVNQQNP